MTKVIQLPKEYLSCSQIALWQSDKERYKRIYFDGREEMRVNNAGMEYGKIVASALEVGADTGDLLTDTAMGLLIKYDIADKEIRTVLKTLDGEIGVLGRPDTLDSKTHAFREYKTGKTKWTQNKAQKHFQLKFYQMLIYLHYGTVLNEAYLDWIETERTPEGVTRPTGRVESFKVSLSYNDIMETMALTSKVAKEIETEWLTYERPPEDVW
jgi:hypothetical protein